MIPFKIFGAIGIYLVTVSPLIAQNESEVSKDYNAEAMLKLCEGTVPDMPADTQSLICTFRIQGVLEVMAANCSAHKVGYRTYPTLMASPPKSRGASRQAFKNYMRANPQIWDAHWAGAVVIAMSEAFPCDLAEK